MKKTHSGFTLVELLITIVILAILATIAMPSYQSFIRSTRLANVRSELAQNAKNLERFYTQKGTFVGFSNDTLIDNTYFDISFDDGPDVQPNPSDAGFILKATPIDKKAEPCSVYMSDSGIFWATGESGQACPGYEEPHIETNDTQKSP
ncbi:type IV pilin protein [Neisseria sp. CCUG12390]|uniref:type IV pilin protein n=1 Tax=Neisseria sp. CCUG12390 TaxID=3392035 RepID=UPI003A0FF161